MQPIFVKPSFSLKNARSTMPGSTKAMRCHRLASLPHAEARESSVSHTKTFLMPSSFFRLTTHGSRIFGLIIICFVPPNIKVKSTMTRTIFPYLARSLGLFLLLLLLLRMPVIKKLSFSKENVIAIAKEMKAIILWK